MGAAKRAKGPAPIPKIFFEVLNYLLPKTLKNVDDQVRVLCYRMAVFYIYITFVRNISVEFL